MKRFGTSVCLFACPFFAVLSCAAQANPWNGSWKMDPSTMKYDGPSFSVTTDAQGYVVTRDGKPGPKTICDAKPHKDNTDGSMVTCSKAGSGYSVDVSENGKQTDRISTTLSPDGKMMTRKNVVYPTDGTSSFTITTEARRISGGPGMNGQWKIVSFKESQDKGILSIEVKGNTVGFKETDNDKPIVCKLDGTPVTFDGRTMAVKTEGTHTLKVTYRSGKGELQRENTFVLSPDGKTITETDVTPNPSPSTMSMKFHKM
jgi:hypothetical protein